MNLFRTGYWHKRVLVVLMLLGLLLQVQSIFACQIMDQSGPVEHCCCDEIALHKQTNNDHVESSVCCNISNELVLKTSTLENEDPIAIVSQLSFDLPLTTLAFLLTSLWLEVGDSSSSPNLWDLDADPGSPGTATYLSTLRLRI